MGARLPRFSEGPPKPTNEKYSSAATGLGGFFRERNSRMNPITMARSDGIEVMCVRVEDACMVYGGIWNWYESRIGTNCNGGYGPQP